LAAGRFPEFCFLSICVTAQSKTIYVGLSDANKLYVCTAPDADPQTLATNVTSFTVASGFVIFTSSAHEANFVPFSSLSSGDIKPWEKRRVERGSRIVTAVPSTMSLVLQMPRGNLETINPRPLVMEVVRQDLDSYDILLFGGGG
jgi:elongator complex protein 1